MDLHELINNMDSKETIIVEEIFKYLPSLSMNTKALLIKVIRKNICKEHCEKEETCKDCSLQYFICDTIEKITEN